MRKRHFLPALLSLSVLALGAAEHRLHTFKKLHLDPHFWGEGAHFGDFNQDGNNDIVSGPYWYEGPEFAKRHEYYPAKQTTEIKDRDGKTRTLPGFAGALTDRNQYSDNFFAFTHDFNADGWTDILILSFPGKDASWYENPKGGEGHWKRHVVFDVVDNESPTFADLTGDGKPELVCNSGGYFGYAAPDWNNPSAKWTWHPISPQGKWQRFTHGLGFGDVNGDGRNDILEKGGWWEQPASLEGDPEWTHHKFLFSPGGGAQMYVYDVDGDGDNDVITSIAAHGYGLAWYEHVKQGGGITFKQHIFVNKEPGENKYGVKFSQIHALEVADMNGDGLPDIVTGKRFWAHGPKGDAEPNAAAVLYWFELSRKGGKVDFIPHLIDDDSGVGTQVVVGDVSGNGLPDVVVGNKKGTFVHLHSVKSVSETEWKKAQPKPLASGAAGDPPAAKKEIAFRQDKGPEGELPRGADGRPLNLDFEQGSLKDWKPIGKAFTRQPVAGSIDENRPHGSGKVARRQGRYWIGGYEILRDTPTGRLESVPFKATHPWASFKIGGGSHIETRAEIVRRESGKAVFTATGRNSETMEHAVVDLRAHEGKEIFIRLVDEHSGGWGHVNFDNFRFHKNRPRFAQVVEAAQPLPPVDQVKHAGLSPENAVQAMTLPEGFSATLFAAEPDVRQPIGFCLDHRGRVWVAESYDYPIRQPEGEGRDRIVIFEDTNGDGRHDKRTVFIENLNLVSSVEVGFGGVWVGSAPHLLFIPDADGDDRPDGEPRVLLDGWGYQDTHEMLNTFTWGPDGWLYGCHGVFTHSNVGKPGTPEDERTRINAGIWRYHPTRHEFEVFAYGTSNPWGIDFNDYGQCFIEACVIPHFFHIIQGARFQRQAGSHFNPHIYDDIKAHGDHVHYLGARPHAGNNRSDAAGGGHAHAGLMVYLGDSWPAKYRNQTFMNNIHGQRINMDLPVRSGSGYVGKHGDDFINFNDLASQIINLRSDQNGSVYMIDWYDLTQCHRRDPEVHDRSNGRIFKVAYRNEKWTPVNLEAAGDSELIAHQLHPNDWYVRHARRVLQHRAATGKLKPDTRGILRTLLTQKDHNIRFVREAKGMLPPAEPTRQLRLMWALHATGGIDEKTTLGLLDHGNEYVRAWAIQLACEAGKPSKPLLEKFAGMAAGDESKVVRMYLASALQRTPLDRRSQVLTALLSHKEDAGDPNLPLMYWYATEPVVGESTTAAVQLLGKTRIPRIREYITRRMTAARKVAGAE